MRASLHSRAAAAVALLLSALAQDPESALSQLASTPLTNYPCTRLLRVDGAIGCGTGPNGVTGLLYAADTLADVDAFLGLGAGGDSPTDPYAVVLPPALLSVANMSALASVSWFAGVLALPDPLPSDFSPAPKNLPVGFPQEFAWNPVGRGLIFTEFQFPVVAVDGPTGRDLHAKALANRAKGVRSYPQWALHMDYYMGPDSLTSVQCLDAGSCLPLGGQSVWGALGGLDSSPPSSSFAAADDAEGATAPVRRSLHIARDAKKRRGRLVHEVATTTAAAAAAGTGVDASPSQAQAQAQAQAPLTRRPQRPVVMAVCPMDAAELFHDLAFGADSAAASITSLLAAAEALSRTDAKSLPLQILFGVFQAEAWGRIGSRRWLGEVRSFDCQENITAVDSPTGRPFCAFPLRTDVSFSSLSLGDFRYVVSADQVGRKNVQSFYLHTDQGSRPASQWLSDVFGALGTSPLPVQPAVARPVPPPTPAVSFEDVLPDIGAAVLSEYDGAFSNPFFHSRFDDASNVDAGTVVSAATVLARGLYAVASNKTTAAAAALAVPADLKANATLVQEILSCITVNAQCDLFARVLGLDMATLGSLVGGPSPLSLYTSVYNQPYTVPSTATTMGYVIQPTPLEAFVRNSLAYFTASSVNGTCGSTGDCQSRVGKAYECLLGQCVVGNAFFHDALSPALAATRDVGEYVVDRTLTDEVDPLWTEPYWSPKIGAVVFQKDSMATEGGVAAAGVLVTAASGVACVYLIRWLDAYFKVP
jgi:hypothetical protein